MWNSVPPPHRQKNRNRITWISGLWLKLTAADSGAIQDTIERAGDIFAIGLNKCYGRNKNKSLLKCSNSFCHTLWLRQTQTGSKSASRSPLTLSCFLVCMFNVNAYTTWHQMDMCRYICSVFRNCFEAHHPYETSWYKRSKLIQKQRQGVFVCLYRLVSICLLLEMDGLWIDMRW